ncbi:heavy metal-binding domain-containing protein [Eubacterium sp. AB3007]|uniref:heavy metal-binding domain-containing protein n=1 Tax=Eubacterium sp. AB3007 TaxID=1392487 RepID=UPI000489E9B6|nr:heavy metal-binding domain-containing protein [Eubacterium sp. AB3007]MBQ1471283.1 heavy metal-binding domain-containing protein [Eubacterium sp.]
MVLLTTEGIPGREYEVLGMVKGNTVQSKHLGKDIGAGLKTLVGGELKGYTEMLSESREVATARMIQEAESLGANAIVAVRYSSASVMDGAAEVLVYGTAVKVK